MIKNLYTQLFTKGEFEKILKEYYALQKKLENLFENYFSLKSKLDNRALPDEVKLTYESQLSLAGVKIRDLYVYLTDFESKDTLFSKFIQQIKKTKKDKMDLLIKNDVFFKDRIPFLLQSSLIKYIDTKEFENPKFDNKLFIEIIGEESFSKLKRIFSDREFLNHKTEILTLEDILSKIDNSNQESNEKTQLESHIYEYATLANDMFLKLKEINQLMEKQKKQNVLLNKVTSENNVLVKINNQWDFIVKKKIDFFELKVANLEHYLKQNLIFLEEYFDLDDIELLEQELVFQFPEIIRLKFEQDYKNAICFSKRTPLKQEKLINREES